MAYRLATPADADLIALLLQRVDQPWTKELLAEVMASPDHGFVLEVTAGIPTGAFCHFLHRADGVGEFGPANWPTAEGVETGQRKALAGVVGAAMREYKSRWPSVKECLFGLSRGKTVPMNALDASAPELTYTVEGDGGRWYRNSWSKVVTALDRIATAAIGSP